MGTGDVSPSVPEIVTHELAEVVAALVLLEGNITTRYCSPAIRTENCLHLQHEASMVYYRQYLQKADHINDLQG